MKKMTGKSFPVDGKTILECLQMSSALIGIIITISAIEIGRLTQSKHYGLPLIALVGVLTITVSLIML